MFDERIGREYENSEFEKNNRKVKMSCYSIWKRFSTFTQEEWCSLNRKVVPFYLFELFSHMNSLLMNFINDNNQEYC